MTTINLSDTEPEPTEYSKKEVFDALSKIISGKDSKDKNILDTLKKFTNNLESTDDSPKKDNEVIEISEVPKNKKNVSKTKIPKKTTKKMQKKISLEDVARQNRNNKITGSLLKEIINDKLFYEREEQIANLIAEINETKKQKEKIKLEIFQAELESMKKKYEIELNKKNKYKDNVRTLQAAVEEKKNEIAKLQTKINVFSDNLQKKREEFEIKIKNYKRITNTFRYG